jgi:glutaredoxin
MAAAPPAAARLFEAIAAPSPTIRTEMADTHVPDLVLYARPACDLCTETRAILRSLLAERTAFGMPSPTLIERDIDTDPEWQRAYFTSIPVVVFAGRTIELATGAAKLRRLLHDVLDG